MDQSLRLGRLFGVQIGVHYSWVIIALLITVSLAQHFYSNNPSWTTGAVWAAAVITGVLFFAGIIAHELAHALVAVRRGLPVRSITLFALGGLAHMEKDAPDATTEFWVGISGPLTSVGIGIVCLLLALAMGWAPPVQPPTPAMAVAVWLGYINLVLAAFNMIPGFPLDGGRVLRAIVWWITGSMQRATRIASGIGQLVALGFILLGIVRFFVGAEFGGLWMALIGWFLLGAARSSYAQVEAAEMLRGIRVRDVTTSDCVTIEGGLGLQEFLDRYLLRTGRRCYIVLDDNRMVGLITPSDVARVEPERRPQLRVRDAMRPAEELRTISPEASAMQGLELLTSQDVNQLPVVANGRLEGVFTRANVLQLLQSHADLKRRVS